MYIVYGCFDCENKEILYSIFSHPEGLAMWQRERRQMESHIVDTYPSSLFLNFGTK